MNAIDLDVLSIIKRIFHATKDFIFCGHVHEHITALRAGTAQDRLVGVKREESNTGTAAL